MVRAHVTTHHAVGTHHLLHLRVHGLALRLQLLGHLGVQPLHRRGVVHGLHARPRFCLRERCPSAAIGGDRGRAVRCERETHHEREREPDRDSEGDPTYLHVQRLLLPPTLSGTYEEAVKGRRSPDEAIGSETVNVVPRPGSLEARMSPPWARTSSLATARPMPEPPARTPRPRKNRSNTWPSSSAGMPGPVSETRMTARSPSTRRARTTSPPGGVNLTAFESRFVTTWRIRVGSAWLRTSDRSVRSATSSAS